MQLKSIIPFLTILFHILFVPFWLNAGTFQENPLTKAIQLFDKEKYAEAEPLFKKLLDDRPDDFMVNYFYGACRTENGHYNEQDLSYLVKASKEVTPLNIDYYLGIQYHSKGQWEKALAYYKLYKTIASTNEQEKVGLTLKMEQCSNHINPFSTSVPEEKEDNSSVLDAGTLGAAAIVKESIGQTNKNTLIPQTIVIDSAYTEISEKESSETEEQEILAENDSTIEFIESEADTSSFQTTDEEALNESFAVLPFEKRIKFIVNNEITYISVSNFKTEEGKIYYEEGSSKESELEAVIKETEKVRETYKNSRSRTEKDSIGQQVLSLEGDAYDLKNVVNQLFLQAKNAENGYWINASPEETENFIKELDAASLASNNENRNITDVVSGSPELIIPPIIMESEEIKSSTPKAKPSGIVYKIQIGAYSRGIPSTQKQAFSKISVIRKVENYTDENGVVVYTTGNLTSYDDAVLMQSQVKREGIKDPKIAAYLNGKRITLEQAKELDKK